MINEEQALELMQSPEKIISAIDCNVCIGFMNGHITDLDMECFEKELIASQHKVNLLKDKTKTVALAEAEFKISKEYIDWQRVLRELRKFRAYRYDLRKKEESLKNSSSYIRNNYGNYKRVIE
jgi:hypothetical protein